MTEEDDRFKEACMGVVDGFVKVNDLLFHVRDGKWRGTREIYTSHGSVFTVCV